jgi:hypothetical protein
MMKRLPIVIASIAIGGLIFVGKSWSQQDAKTPPTTSRASSASVPSSNVIRSEPASISQDFNRRKVEKLESVKTARKIERLMNQLGEAEETKGTSSISVMTVETPGDAPKKAELTKQLEAAVAESFDEDMKVREGELSKLEERLNKLRAQLDRRRKAKGEIIQLEVKVLVNEAAGLGFSGGLSQGRRKGFMGVSKSFRRSLDDSDLALPQEVEPQPLAPDQFRRW